MRPFIAGFCLIFALSASDRVTFRSTVTSVKVDAQVLQRGASGLVRSSFRVRTVFC